MAPTSPALRHLRPVLVLTLLLIAACGGGGQSAVEPSHAPPAASYALPFGLRQVPGTSPVARPAVYNDASGIRNGRPVEARFLRAAYVVTADDPMSVLRAWADQMVARLPLQVEVGQGDLELGQWAIATALDYDDPSRGLGRVQLWTTNASPLLLVDIHLSQSTRLGPGSRARGYFATPIPRPGKAVTSKKGRAGDVLFEEQGKRLRLPDGTRGLIPRLPTPGGTGGSYNVLAAEDAPAAVAELLAEAREHNKDAEVEGPTDTEEGSLRLIRAAYVISAGGWSFTVVSVQEAGEAEATLYVSSAAD